METVIAVLSRRRYAGRAPAHAASAHPPDMRRHAHRLPRWQRLTLYLSGASLLLSGTVWLALHYGVGAGAGGLPHPFEAWTMRLHGLAAFGAIFVLGVLAASHIPQGWRMSRRRGWARQRALGAVLCASGAALVATGYALYYFAPESIRPALGWVHSVAGALMAVFLGLHRRHSPH